MVHSTTVGAKTVSSVVLVRLRWLPLGWPYGKFCTDNDNGSEVPGSSRLMMTICR